MSRTKIIINQLDLTNSQPVIGTIQIDNSVSGGIQLGHIITPVTAIGPTFESSYLNTYFNHNVEQAYSIFQIGNLTTMDSAINIYGNITCGVAINSGYININSSNGFINIIANNGGVTLQNPTNNNILLTTSNWSFGWNNSLADVELNSTSYPIVISTTALTLTASNNIVLAPSANTTTAKDIAITDNAHGLLLTSPNGTQFRVSVKDSGIVWATPA